MEIWGWAVKLYGHIYIMYETFIFATRIVELNTAIQNLWLRYYFSMTQQSLLDQVLLIIVALLSNSDTPHSVGLLWTRGQPDAEASTWQYTTITRDSHPCPGGIRTYKPSERPQTHALDRSATGIGFYVMLLKKLSKPILMPTTIEWAWAAWLV